MAPQKERNARTLDFWRTNKQLWHVLPSSKFGIIYIHAMIELLENCRLFELPSLETHITEPPSDHLQGPKSATRKAMRTFYHLILFGFSAWQNIVLWTWGISLRPAIKCGAYRKQRDVYIARHEKNVNYKDGQRHHKSLTPSCIVSVCAVSLRTCNGILGLTGRPNSWKMVVFQSMSS